ncbi:MAG: class I SAM-dependent methyltransferase [Proteobacteria bacterium]|nr:class I SAM-dependent methyltransferase [Pseudomonadota bacterium]
MPDKEKWNERYKDTSSDNGPASLLLDNAHLFAKGKALDVAMGLGNNAFFLAAQGYAVTGVDISSVAVTRAAEHAKKNGLTIQALEADLAEFPIKDENYDLIVNFYFLDRTLIPKLKKGLKKNGLIFFETYTTEQRQFGGPSNPDYLLKPNELLLSFLDFFIIYYHERIIPEAQPRAIASLIAQKVS